MFNSSDIISITKDKNNSIFKLSWKLTSWCNYNCSYCSQETRQAKFTPQDILELRANKLNKIIDSIDDKKLVELSLIGGEITYYNLINILKNINLSKINLLRITTNFSQTNDYFIELLNFLSKINSNLKINFMLSFHDEYVVIDKFISKVTALQQEIDAKYANFKVRLIISLVINNNLDSRLLSSLIKKYPYLVFYTSIERNIEREVVELDVEHQEFKNSLLVKENSNKLIVKLKSGEELYFSNKNELLYNIVEKTFLSEDYLCTVGLTNLRIDEFGNIKRGQCHLDLKKNILGSIDLDILPNKPVVCSFDKHDNKHTCVLCPWSNIIK